MYMYGTRLFMTVCSKLYITLILTLIIIDARDKKDRTPLHIACIERDREVAMYLIEETSCNPSE